jgi:hypothetical protein
MTGDVTTEVTIEYATNTRDTAGTEDTVTTTTEDAVTITTEDAATTTTEDAATTATEDATTTTEDAATTATEDAATTITATTQHVTTVVAVTAMGIAATKNVVITEILKTTTASSTMTTDHSNPDDRGSVPIEEQLGDQVIQSADLAVILVASLGGFISGFVITFSVFGAALCIWNCRVNKKDYHNKLDQLTRSR